MPGQRVVTIGLLPEAVDFSKFPGLDAEKLMAGIVAQTAELRAEGFDTHVCLTDAGATAEAVVTQMLQDLTPDVIVFGAGVRTSPEHLLLFERLLNLAHRLAPQAALCFNTRPTDSLAAVRRWAA